MKLKKIMKCSLALALVLGTASFVVGCGNDDSISKNNDKQYEIYKLAKDAGATDLTYEEWLVSIKGAKGDKGADGHTPNITIGSNGNWFIDGTDTAVKATGSAGEAGKDGASWLVGTINPNNLNGKDGDFYFDSLTQKIYRKENGVWVEKTTINDGVDGKDGKQIEIRTTESQIQWKYVGETTWNNLIALSELKGFKGDDGKKIEIQTSATHIQWRYEGDVWQDLVSLESLKGKDGTKWITGAGVPSDPANVGDFYFDTENNDIYLYTSNGWVLEVDLEVKEEVVLDGVYTGYFKGFDLELEFSKGEVVKIMVDDEEVTSMVNFAYTYENNIIDCTISIDDPIESVEYHEKYTIRGDRLVKYIENEVMDLLKGPYFDSYSSYNQTILNLGETSFSLVYKNKSIVGTWETIATYEWDEAGEVFLLSLNSGDTNIVAYVMYARREFDIDFDDFIYRDYITEDEKVISLSSDDEEGIITISIDGQEPIEVDAYNVMGDESVLYVEVNNGGYILDLMRGTATEAINQNSLFIGECIIADDIIYIKDNDYLVRIDDMNEEISEYFDNYTISVANGGHSVVIQYSDNKNNYFQVYADIYDFNKVSDTVYTYEDTNGYVFTFEFNEDLTLKDFAGPSLWDGTIGEVPQEVNSVITITKAEQLAALAKSVNEGNTYEGITIELDADLDLNNYEWIPIGYGTSFHIGTVETGYVFKGIIDGKNHTIYNLRITDFRMGGLNEGNAATGIGLIGHNSGTIKNLTIDGAVVRGNHFVGALSGFNLNATIDNCHVKNADIVNSFYDEDDSGDKAGALIGYIAKGLNQGDAASVTNSSAQSSRVSSNRDAGQVIGCIAEGATESSNTAIDVEVLWDGDNWTEGKSGTNIKNEIVGRVA